MPNSNHRSRSALVLGGSGDIGAAIVTEMVAAGWEVTFTYASGESFARALAKHSGAKAVRYDFKQGAGVPFDQPLGAMVHCIGINPTDLPIMDTSESEFRRTIDTNLTSAFIAAKAMFPHLRDGGGSIVHVSSIWGLRAVEGIVGYVASKHAMRGLTASLAREFGPEGVTTNEVCPGPVRSAMLERCIRREVGDDELSIKGYHDSLIQQTPTRRLVTPKDIADAVVFLCSDGARSINGASLVVDGGMTA